MQTNSSKSSNYILFNTLVMYLRIIVNICIGLLTTRYVLEALGLDDFGIFGLVGSVIGLLAFLNSTMAGTTLRFLSFHRKLGDLSSVFSTSIVLHFLIGIAVVVLLEAGGFLFLDTLNIHVERMAMAYFVFHCVAVITFFSIIATPYQALINANEDMYLFIIFSTIETFIKLGIAFLLFITPYDRLGTYAVAMMALAILMRFVQGIFCKIRYPSIFFSYQSINKELTFKMLSFSSWTFFVSICNIFSFKGLHILVNLFFGTTMNAFFSLVNQVTAQLSNFSSNLSLAFAPQIVSGIAAKNLERSKILAISSCKFQLFIVSLLGIPLFFNIDYVLSLWLKQVPEYLSGLCCLALVYEIMLNFTRGLQSLIDGRGYIRGYRVAIGFSNLIILPIVYLFLKMGYSPYFVYVALLIYSVFVVIFQIYFAHRHVALSVPHFLKEMSKVLATVIIAFLCTWLIVPKLFSIFNSQFIILTLSTILSSTLMFSGFWFAMNAKEREFAKGVWVKIRNKI